MDGALSAPLLLAEGARPLVDGLHADTPFDARSQGRLVMLVGASAALRAVLFGSAAVAETAASGRAASLVGRLDLAGLSARDGAHAQRFGLSSYGAALPERMTLSAYLAWGARLRGHKRSEAAVLADAALTKWQLQAQSRRKLAQLSPVEVRAVSLAYACVTQPAGLILDRPFDGLADEHAVLLSGLLSGLLADASHVHDLILLVSALDATGPYAAWSQRASDVLMFRGGRLLSQQSGQALWQRPRHLELAVLGDAEPLCAALRAQGIEVEGAGDAWLVTLPEDAGPHTVLREAVRTDTALLRCAPLLGASSQHAAGGS